MSKPKLPRLGALVALVAASVAFAAATPATAAAGPLFDVKATWGNTNLPPGGEGQFTIQARNIGDATPTEAIHITDELPAGVTAKAIHFMYYGFDLCGYGLCSGTGTGTIGGEIPSFFLPEIARPPGGEAPGLSAAPTGYLPVLFVEVEVEPGASGVGTNVATISGGNAPAATDTDQVPFSSTPSSFGLTPGSYQADFFNAAYPQGSPSRIAGDHPFELRVNFDLNTRIGTGTDGTRETIADALIRDVEVTLPRGVVGNPEALPKCNPVDFAEFGPVANATACPTDTQVGYLDLAVTDPGRSYGRGFFGNSNEVLTRVALYNLKPPKGAPADFGFDAGGFVQGHIYPNVDPGQNYAIKTLTPNISNLLTVKYSEVTVWGVPGDPAHDKFRYYPEVHEGNTGLGAPFGDPTVRPLLTNPTDCGFDNGGARIRVDSYSDPGNYTPVEEWPNADNVTGCNDPRFRFEPDISVQPTSRAAGGPTGLDVSLKVPQRNDAAKEAKELYAENGYVKGISTPPLKKAVVTFPEGMTVNPSSSQGLSACTPAEIGMGTDSPVTCPDSSQFGTLKLKTPILPIDGQPEGWIYVAKPYDNPFHSFLALYLVIQEPERGLLVKLAGKGELDPKTGQITFSFDDLPQIPMEEATMSVNSGLRAGLVNPGTCGVKTISADFYSWQEPTTPRHVTSNYDVTQNPNGSPCHNSLSERPFSPNLSGGTRNNLAGSYSPLDIRLSRSDEDQQIERIEGTGPPGLLASIKGVGRCSDAAIAAAANPERTGTEELEHPSCPADSQVGTVVAGAGTGQVLTYVPGKIYLAGPYEGAPLSGVAVVPAVSGPFDLGVVVTRAPAYVNPQTAELTIKTDPLPQIFKGVPLRVRDIRVHLDRNRFTLNPTSCDPFSLGGTVFSTEGKSKDDGTRFQAADCATLGFRPALYTRLFGGTKRGAHPKFRGVYKGREGQANTKSVIVTMPRSEFLDQSHIGTVCTRVQFAAAGGNGGGCPRGSIYGHATARTPLLDETLQGPVYLRSSNHKLPDLVAELHGIVNVEVDGRIDSKRGGIRASFESVPDVPVESFTITMQGGKKGLLINSRDICAHAFRAEAAFGGQNGKRAVLHPRLNAKCGRKPRAKRHRHRHAKRASLSAARAR